MARPLEFEAAADQLLSAVGQSRATRRQISSVIRPKGAAGFELESEYVRILPQLLFRQILALFR